MKAKKKWYQKKYWWVTGFIFVILAIVLFYNQFKPLPPGISYESEMHSLPDHDVDFLYDLTYQKDGQEKYDQSIFQEVYNTIEKADDFIIVDMFLFNDYTDKKRHYPNISETLSKAIQRKMKANPDLKVVFISDEVNTTYGSHVAKELKPLEELGAEVILTNLNRLRDPTPLYSALWRSSFKWFGQAGTGWLPNPMAKTAPKVTLRSYLKLLNIKANHRKVVITEDAGLIISANAHDASGFHSNIGFKVRGPIIKELVQAEKAVAKFSDGNLNAFPSEQELDKLSHSEMKAKASTNVKTRILTEQKIQARVVDTLNHAKKGDEVWLGMFYLADRDIIDAIEDAANRKVNIHIILDPNQNAFGQEKSGLPNIPIAEELHKLNNDHISIRWYNTNKEQYHTKLIYVKGKSRSTIIGGSANYTSRNLDDYNLEENIMLTASSDSHIVGEVDQYFHRIWENKDGTYTLPYKKIEGKLPVFKYILYVLQKIFHVTTY